MTEQYIKNSINIACPKIEQLDVLKSARTKTINSIGPIDCIDSIDSIESEALQTLIRN